MTNSTVPKPTYAELLAVIKRQEGVIACQEQVMAQQNILIAEQAARIEQPARSH